MSGRAVLAGLAVLSLIACGEEPTVDLPPPQELTRDATGYYCKMIVVDHRGPKAQIQLRGQSEPLWFTQVRDAIAFTERPEEPKDIAAIYVNDMGRAGSWDDPGRDNWIEAADALYVIESDQPGGMGAPEAVPFAERAAAAAFAAAHGGRVVTYDEVPEDYVTAVVGEAEMERAMEHMRQVEEQP